MDKVVVILLGVSEVVATGAPGTARRKRLSKQFMFSPE
jgi:hypothetical protein